jgi:hypothetical protein
MAMEECCAVADSLRGVKFLRRDVKAVLDRFDLRTMFGTIPEKRNSGHLIRRGLKSAAK